MRPQFYTGLKKKKEGQKLISRSSTFVLRPRWTQFLGVKNKLDHTSYHWGVLAGGPELGGYTIIYTILY